MAQARLPIADHRCPACDLVVQASRAEEGPNAFRCPHCRAHVELRDGHLHLVFDSRDAPAAHDADEVAGDDE